ncbi:MAG: APC family permease [Gammaproteobacteria bacterium]
MSSGRLERKVGLGGAVFLLIGHIVGASIFILPGQLAGIAGPAVFIAYLIASIPAIVNCLIAAQVGSILPVSAGDYVFTSVALHPLLGFLKVWAGMLALMVGVPILAFGFADYMAYFLPDVPRLSIAIGVVVVILGVNLLGIHTSVRTQMAMVTVFVASLLTFGIGGLFYVDWSLLDPMVPNGAGSVISAAIPAFYSYSGFLAIVVIGEEIREPRRNVPLTLLITFILVAVIYTLITLVLPGLVPWRELGAMVAPMGSAARLFLPDWFAVVITLSALLAAATSINTVVLTTSRSFFALARNRIYPRVFSHLNHRTNEPHAALLLVGGFVMIGIALQGDIVQYAAVTVIGSMLYGMVWAVAMLRLPKAFPEHYGGAAFRLKPATIWIIATIKMVVSVAFLYVGVRDNLGPALIYFVLLAMGAVYYYYRQQLLDREDISLDALLRREVDEAASATQSAA